MSLADDIRERLAAPFYILWSKVNQGFLNSALGRANLEYQRIQSEALVDHYPIELGTNGTPPANFFGSAGAVEADAVLRLVEWYDTQTPANVDAWLLSVEGELLWRKDTGIIPPSPTRYTSYVNDFLPNVSPPNLAPIDPEQVVAALSYLLCPADQVAEIQSRYDAAAGVPSPLDVPLSSSGNPPITHYAANGRYPAHNSDLLKMAFPVKPGDPVDLVLLGLNSVPFWNNDTGDLTGSRPLRFAQFLADNNLKPI